MKSLDIFKQVIFIGAIPCFMFLLAVLSSFLLFPYDVDGASWTIMTLTLTGCLVAIFLLVHNVRFFAMQIYKRWKDDSHSDT